MNLELVRSIAAAATDVDGAEPLDEGTWLSLRSGDADWLGVVTDEGFALTHGEDLHLVVHPTARRRGLATSWLEGIQGPAQAWSHGGHPAAATLASRFGFERARDLWVMRRPMGEPLPPPSDVEIRAWTPGDTAELLRVNAEAFAHHPEQGSMDEANLAARMAEPWFDPAGLLVAVDGDRMLGFHWTKQHSPDLGEVYVVGIDPTAQSRGLGRALTLAGLHHLAGRGVSEVLLYVEADNHAARSTYAKLGFSHADADTHVMYRREA
ncbi:MULTISPECIES: mycothiol synthase [Nocardioides]|uniref:mycothiol synthase n=1 Tax=Nocardioides TaxID=1839 RepID=UPI00032F48D0|nr:MULTISPECIES: mycothiol synthase [Nocardioides]EON22778.1 GCN5-related N-acetyltransferase [Nocardioides sp. CF8]